MARSIIARTGNEIRTDDALVRQWSVVEIHGDAWYQVETGLVGDLEAQTTTYVTTRLNEALAVLADLPRAKWTALRLVSYLPGGRVEAMLCEDDRRPPDEMRMQWRQLNVISSDEYEKTFT